MVNAENSALHKYITQNGKSMLSAFLNFFQNIVLILRQNFFNNFFVRNSVQEFKHSNAMQCKDMLMWCLHDENEGRKILKVFVFCTWILRFLWQNFVYMIKAVIHSIQNSWIWAKVFKCHSLVLPAMVTFTVQTARDMRPSRAECCQKHSRLISSLILNWFWLSHIQTHFSVVDFFFPSLQPPPLAIRLHPPV